MSRIRVALIGELYDCVKPLFDGTLEADGIELAVTRSPSPQAMRRQLTAWEFDVCEMAFGAYLIARAQGADVTAIPVFPRRAFFHIGFMCHANARVAGPNDLAGKRIGVPEYVQSATLWARGVLEHDFGLDAGKAHWYVERAGAESTGKVLGFKPPRAISVQPTPGGKSLAAMLAAAELDVALLGTSAQTQAGNALRPLFADPIAEGRRFYQAHGYVPANHLYMVRGTLAREHPDLVSSLYRALGEAKRVAERSGSGNRSRGVLFGSEQLAIACEPFAADPFCYGIEPNRAMLHAVVGLCREQGLVSVTPAAEELFMPGMD